MKSYSSQEKSIDFFPPQTTAKSWALYEAESGKFIDGKSAYTQREVASLTKIMTLYTALNILDKYKLDLSKIQFYVSYQASKMSGTSAELQEDMLIGLEDLFYGMMLPSGNDAAWCIAENLGKLLWLFSQMYYDNDDEKEVELQKVREILYDYNQFYQETDNIRYPVGQFLSEMNKKAKQLNLQQTYYANPHGLMYKDNKSSAYDVGNVCCHALKLAFFCKIVSTKQYTALIRDAEGEIIEKTWTNTNKLLWKGWDGLKTGITDAAGPCLAAAHTVYDSSNSYKKDSQKKQFVVVLLSCKNMDIRWEECEKIVTWARKQCQFNQHD